MGRKKLTVNIGDVYGGYTVIGNSYIKGEHSFVKVKCKCGNITDLCVSELKNRPKQHCYKCKGDSHRLYPDPKNGDIYDGWKVLNFSCRKNGFMFYICECLKCGHVMEIRKDQLVSYKLRVCPKCKNNSNRKPKIKKAKINKSIILRNNPFQTKFNSVVREAAKRSIPVNFTPEDLQNLYYKQNQKCALSGDYLPDIRKASIDRIDSFKDYSLTNIQIVTKEINLAKHILSQDAFINMCKKVVNHANQQPSTPLTKCEGSETNP